MLKAEEHTEMNEEPVKGFFMNAIQSGISEIEIPPMGRMEAIREKLGGLFVLRDLHDVTGDHLYHVPTDHTNPNIWYQFWDFGDGEYLIIPGSSVLVGYDRETEQYRDVSMDREYLAQMCRFIDFEEAIRLAKKLDVSL